MVLKIGALLLFLTSQIGFAGISAANSASDQDRRTNVAVVVLGNSGPASRALEILSSSLASFSELHLLDPDQVTLAVKGSGQTASLNMSLEEASNLGSAIGCDYYFLIDVQTLRRSPSTGPLYFESYASIFLISARTGRLVAWQRPKYEEATPAAAEKLLLTDLAASSSSYQHLNNIRSSQEEERVRRQTAFDKNTPLIESAPDNDKVAEAQGLRLPRPYRRLTPPYPATAASAEVEATVDVLVEIDANGEVGKLEIARWAGFGLDEVTIETVKQLHFFPAIRNGTRMPMRVLLRYNFRKPAR